MEHYMQTAGPRREMFALDHNTTVLTFIYTKCFTHTTKYNNVLFAFFSFDISSKSVL